MVVPAGSRDRYVTIERQAVTGQDVLGQDIISWVTWKRAWMGKRQITASERFRANQELTSETVVWNAPWIEGIESGDRLNHDGTIYEIEGAPIENGRGSGLEITTTAVRV